MYKNGGVRKKVLSLVLLILYRGKFKLPRHPIPTTKQSMALFGELHGAFASPGSSKSHKLPNGVRFSKPRKLQKLFFTLQAEKLHRSSFPSFWRPSSLPRVPLPRGRRPRSVATRRPPSARPRRRLFSSPPLMVSTRAPPAGRLHRAPPDGSTLDPSSTRLHSSSYRLHPSPPRRPPPFAAGEPSCELRLPPPELRPAVASAELRPTDPSAAASTPRQLGSPAASAREPLPSAWIDAPLPLPSARLARPTPLPSAWTAAPLSSPKAPLEKLPQTAQLAFSKS